MALQLPKRINLDPVNLGISTPFIEKLARHVISSSPSLRGWRVTPYVRDVIKGVLSSSNVDQNTALPNTDSDEVFLEMAKKVSQKLHEELMEAFTKKPTIDQ